MAKLTIRDAEGRESRLGLERGRRYSIGRSEHNDVTLHDALLSRRHAELTFDRDGWLLTDCGSSNGTFVNGRRLTRSARLSSRDRVRMGDCRLRLGSDGSVTGQVSLADGPPPTTDTLKLSASEASFDGQIAASPGDVSRMRAELKAIRRRYAVVERANLELLSHEPLEALLPKALELVSDAVQPDRAALLMVDGDGELTSRAERGLGDGELSISRTIASSVISERASILTADALIDERFAAGHSIAAQQIRGAMAVPLWNNREVTGLIYVDCLQSDRSFDEQDLKLLTMLANVVAIQIENANLFHEQLEKRRLEEEAQAAAEIQQALLPGASPAIPGYEFLGYSQPCHEVGGDYYDCVRYDERRALIALADVSGKGMSAALLMAGLHANFHARIEALPPIEEIVARLNVTVAEATPMNRFITFFLMELDHTAHRIRAINAGHVPGPRVVRAAGEVLELRCEGPPLGFLPDFEYPVVDLRLEPGDMVFLASDGVTELNDGERRMFGEQRLTELLCATAGQRPEEVRDALDRRLAGYAGDAPRTDDLTVAIVQRRRD